MEEYYVYALIDPRNNQIFYIGKGKGDRYLQHIKEVDELSVKKNNVKKGINPNKVSRIKEIIDSGNELKYRIIAQSLTEECAYILEELLVERFGRDVLKNGQLLNLEPGGKWEYPKLILKDEEKTTIEDVQARFPKIISILKEYPHVATESKLVPWWVSKIPKRFALFQYSQKGDYLETHNINWMNSSTGMSWRVIKKCIDENNGYAYNYQWSFEKREKLINMSILQEDEFQKLVNFMSWQIKEVENNEMTRYYSIRNQEVEE